MLDIFPPELITLITWLILFISASALILIVSIGLGRILSGFVQDIMGMVK
jgi:hypothetical protein